MHHTTEKTIRETTIMAIMIGHLEMSAKLTKEPNLDLLAI
jgi:hypothetical protein